MKLNEQQEAAANHIDGPCLVTACPGSGKTRTVVERTARLIASGVKSNSIMCITFTNKAAEEMRERLEKRLGEDAHSLWISTFHRLGSTVIRKQGGSIGYRPNVTICAPDDQVDLMAQCARQLELELTKPEIKKIVWQLNDSRENLETDSELHDRLDRLDDQYYTIAKEYLDRLMKSNMVDLTGILSETVRLFTEAPDVLARIHKRFKYFMVDETQDTNGAQFKLVELLGKDSRNIFIVGDTDQCQPAGTKVLTTNHGEVDIKDLDPNVHKLVSFSSRDSVVLGWRNGLSFKKAHKFYFGNYWEVNIGSKKTLCTPNHKWTFRLKKNELVKYDLVYLMRAGEFWRVGHTSAFRLYGSKSKVAFGPIMRARQEKADAVWVLKVCNSPCEAQMWEQIISCRYGIPTTCFTSGKCLLENLQVIYNELPKVQLKADQCLFDHGRSVENPIWQKRDEINPDFGRRIPLLITACNLLPEIMQIPVPLDGKEFEWTDFKVRQVPPPRMKCTSDGFVYSLDVERHGHYIADGIITHNSIYGWRGARAENLSDFQKVFPECKIYKLGKNYRSTPQIIKVADKLIRHNSNRIEVEFTTDNPSGPPVVCKGFNSTEIEAQWVAEQIAMLTKTGTFAKKDVAIFYRINSMSRALEMALLNKGLAYNVIGNFSFFDRREVKDSIAMLRFLVNPHDGIAFSRFANKPKRHLGDAAIGKIENFAKANTVGNILEASKRIGEYVKNESTQDGVIEVLRVFDKDWTGKTAAEALTIILTELKYEEYLKADDEETFDDRKENLEELVKDAARFASERPGASIADYIESVSLMTDADAKQEDDAVAMMSGHASKGLEFKIVFIIGAEQDIIPHKRAVDEREDGLPEERRLMYVMITRAMQILAVTYCIRRQQGAFSQKGKVSYKPSTPSQFLFEAGLIKIQKKTNVGGMLRDHELPPKFYD